MAYILAIETATRVCSVALFQDSTLLSFKEEDGNYSHAENLAVFVDEIIKENGIDYDQLNVIAISKGPGSYTGLRIGVSFAKGLCYSLGLPLVSIDTLKSMAFGAKKFIDQEDCLLIPMIDARRMEVYSAIYNYELDLINPITAKVIDEDSYSDVMSGNTAYFFGDGSAKCESLLSSKGTALLPSINTSARYLGALAFEKYKEQEFEDVAYFEPYYLKEFIAIKGKKLV